MRSVTGSHDDVYNLVLAAVVLTYFAMGLPATQQLLTVNFVLFLFLLAVLANVGYCAAYAVDIFAQTSGFRERWQKFRWLLFLIGTAFAGAITGFWSMAIFNPGHSLNLLLSSSRIPLCRLPSTPSLSPR